jgi:hypothetical protein
MTEGFRNVYYRPPYPHCPDVVRRYVESYGRYLYRFMHEGVKYEGRYQTARKAALAMDKKFISLGLYDRLQVLKRVKDKREAA